MVTFKITPDRIAEACNIMEYILLQNGNAPTIAKVCPRFVVGADGEYIVKVVLDNDGDIEKFENMSDAFLLMSGVTPKRLEKLTAEFTEAVRNIVNPTSARA